MVTKLTLILEQPEYSALLDAASKELRNPADQARFILRRELAECGLLTTEPAPVAKSQEAQHDR